MCFAFMNKALLLSLSLLFGLSLSAQTIVSTEHKNNRPVIEYCGGVQCDWCPLGHDVASSAQISSDAVIIRNTWRRLRNTYYRTIRSKNIDK